MTPARSESAEHHKNPSAMDKNPVVENKLIGKQTETRRKNTLTANPLVMDLRNECRI